MFDNQDFFSRCKKCSNCGRPLPNDYRFELCADCEDYELFDRVREFIREHDVNEIQVAEHFRIPRRKIRAWIREGRIQYKNSPESLTPLRCRKCGNQIQFGEYCYKCLRSGGGEIYYKK